MGLPQDPGLDVTRKPEMFFAAGVIDKIKTAPVAPGAAAIEPGRHAGGLLESMAHIIWANPLDGGILGWNL